jgi:hypothetical protein
MPKKSAKSDPQVKQEFSKDGDVADLLHRDPAQAGSPPLWTLVCPITNSIFDEPVVASDGRTYSKQALRSFMASCAERGLPVTSPFGDALSEKLEPDVNMAAAVHKYRDDRATANQSCCLFDLRRVTNLLAGRPRRQEQLGSDEEVPGMFSDEDAPMSAAPGCIGAKRKLVAESDGRQTDQIIAKRPRRAAGEAVKSIAELGRVFALLDGSLRGLLAATLDGWQPPQVVVVGEESSGKSSVLERLMMTPLLPRAENICTRLPIHVRLRRSDRALPPKLEVFNLITNTTERGPYVIAAQSGAADVSEEMGRIIKEEQGALKGVSATRIIILHISSPDVPFLDLIDMPGLVTAPSGSEPSDIASQTEAVVKAHMQSKQGSNSLYLAIVKATSAPNTSNAMKILNEAKLYGKTFGVFTFCDELNQRNAPRLKQWVRNGQGAVVLDPYGW